VLLGSREHPRLPRNTAGGPGTAPRGSSVRDAPSPSVVVAAIRGRSRRTYRATAKEPTDASVTAVADVVAAAGGGAPSQWRECCSRFCCLELEWPTERSHETCPRFPFFEEAGVPARPSRQQKSMQMHQC
jgi:hypothetical protein